MKRSAAILCAAVLTATLLILPAQASMTTDPTTPATGNSYTGNAYTGNVRTGSDIPQLPTYYGSYEDITTPPPGMNAADIYTGPVDSFTGNPVGAAEGELGGDRVSVNDYTGYNRERHMFFAPKCSQELLSSVADDMIVTDPVTLLVPEGVTVLLYRDGNQVSEDLTNITAPGSYVLMENNAASTELMRFTIVQPVTGKLHTFEVPEGFSITSAKCEGNPVKYGKRTVSMEQEGLYIVEYSCPVTETRYSFTVGIDHTPPTLALPGVDEKGQAHGPVDISDLEEGAKIGVWLNQNEITPPKVLTQRGGYHIILADEAGNRSEYQFYIRFYFRSGEMFLILAILAVVVGAGAYMIITRRRLRVR